MTKQNENDVNPARFAELELENEELKEKLAKREHDAAEIADALEAAQRNGGRRTHRPEVYLVVLWAVITARLIESMEITPSGDLGFLLIDVFFIGLTFMFACKWMWAEIRLDMEKGVLKSMVMTVVLFVAPMIYTGGDIGDGNVTGPHWAGWTLAWVWLFFCLLSPWSAPAKVYLAKWLKGRMQREKASDDGEEVYDGLGEN